MPDAVGDAQLAATQPDRAAPANSPTRPTLRPLLRAIVAPTFLVTLTSLAILLQWQDNLVVTLSGAGAAFLLTPLIALIIRFVITRLFGWRTTLCRLNLTLQKVREGDLPIDELTRIEGPFTPLALQCRDLLIELRRKSAQLAAADHEARQRIANRTNALERLVGSLRQQANRDPLTGLYNRRGLEPHLAELIAQAQTSSQDLCVLMLDLDRFKALNDTLGHAAGDAFLRSVGQIIRSTIRPDHDAAFRTGGDEFVITLPESTTEDAAALATRLTSLIDALGKTTNPSSPAGISIGCIALSEIDQPDPSGLLKAADRRLYDAKSTRKSAA